MRRYLLASFTILAIGCGDKEKDDEGPVDSGVGSADDTFVAPTDSDGDGYTAAEDCDDADPGVHPGRIEECNGTDDNCNGSVDEGFADADADATPDCLDEEECDGKDNDGDGDVDEGYADVDSDGVADCVGSEICDGVDNDADGQVDEGYDADGDGYTSCEGDCDDANADANPDENEAADDLIDNDCNGMIDEGKWSQGDLLITEMMTNPAAVADPEGEWIEVYNNTDENGLARTVILNGLTIETIDAALNSETHQVLSDTVLILEPGEYFIFGIEDDASLNGGVTVGYEYVDISLSNEASDLAISAGEIVLDQVTWDEDLGSPDISGSTISLDPSYYDTSLNDVIDAWCAGISPWDQYSDRGTPGEDNYPCIPTAVAALGADSTLATCDLIHLDGSGSTETPGTTLTYEWELVDAPAGSQTTSADIEEDDDESPTFLPDQAGTYQFSLTVFNGYEYSEPSYLTVTVVERDYNTNPTANAGPDQSYSEAAICYPVSYGAYYTCSACADHEFTLDGTSTTDADGDWMTYSWAITENASYASITDEDTLSPTVTVTGVSTTYGSAATVMVGVTLTVTDCMGATGTDTVDLYYTCSGS